MTKNICQDSYDALCGQGRVKGGHARVGKKKGQGHGRPCGETCKSRDVAPDKVEGAECDGAEESSACCPSLSSARLELDEAIDHHHIQTWIQKLGNYGTQPLDEIPVDSYSAGQDINMMDRSSQPVVSPSSPRTNHASASMDRRGFGQPPGLSSTHVTHPVSQTRGHMAPPPEGEYAKQFEDVCIDEGRDAWTKFCKRHSSDSMLCQDTAAQEGRILCYF
ncbi:hypothetical protein ED733_008840 [Metarhizium rileyi]|uniref:Uncharacterized protein n=1 Tax=Metarhizium rileyi (strain RCEF 4871) TaxID=1649241 RepID=A0A5C6GKW1_METRR|nr:hypothetical protein ED733_008840 [Metarhizium rileyi]